MITTSAMARNIALGNSLPGFFMLFTWTAFTSMPAYDRKLFTISTSPAMPAICGMSAEVALDQVDDAEDDQRGTWDRRSQQHAAARELGDQGDAAHADHRRDPVDDDDHHCRVVAVAGQARHEDVRERGGHVGQQAGGVGERHRKLGPDGEKARLRRDALTDPVVDAAVPAGGQLGGDQ